MFELFTGLFVSLITSVSLIVILFAVVLSKYNNVSLQ